MHRKNEGVKRCSTYPTCSWFHRGRPRIKRARDVRDALRLELTMENRFGDAEGV